VVKLTGDGILIKFISSAIALGQIHF